jgi:hypothetical protein
MSQRAETAAQGYINTALTAILMTASIIILVDSVRRWTRGRRDPAAEGQPDAAVSAA